MLFSRIWVPSYSNTLSQKSQDCISFISSLCYKQCLFRVSSKEQTPHQSAESSHLPLLSFLCYLHPLIVQVSPLVPRRRWFLFKTKGLKLLEYDISSSLGLKLENFTHTTQTTLGGFDNIFCSCCSSMQRLHAAAGNQSPGGCLLHRGLVRISWICVSRDATVLDHQAPFFCLTPHQKPGGLCLQCPPLNLGQCTSTSVSWPVFGLRPITTEAAENLTSLLDPQNQVLCTKYDNFWPHFHGHFLPADPSVPMQQGLDPLQQAGAGVQERDTLLCPRFSHSTLLYGTGSWCKSLAEQHQWWQYSLSVYFSCT